MTTFEQQRSREGRKHPADMLRDLLATQSQKANEAAKNEGLEGDLLSPEGALDPKGYAAVYDERTMQSDADFVQKRERDFSGVTNVKKREFYREKYGEQTDEAFINTWRKNESEAKNGQMEMAVTALLSQKLGGEFLVVRTARYDDYANGVDNLILDRVTGEVVGAFDEYHEGGYGTRTQEKRKKVEKAAKNGGSNIKYGLKLRGGKLVRASLEGVPVFCLGLATSELEELVQGLATNDSGKTDKIFNALLVSLIEQHAELEDMPTTKVFSARLASFSKSLTRLTNAPRKKAA